MHIALRDAPLFPYMMPIPVQSSNVAKICSELGFSGAYPNREEKDLTAHTLNFPIESLSQATPFPFFKADSVEAKQLAIKFCDEDQRGQLLWPDNNHQGWPTWSSERQQILKLVAHIFSLQAFYRYQKRCKEGKKRRIEASATMESGTTSVRELSPESRLFVGPSPPKGTRRRPAKKINGTSINTTSQGDPSTTITESGSQPDTYMLAAYIEHIESLDPDDDKKPLREFTRKWLSKSNSEWPISADPRVYTFMHTNQFYDPEHQEDTKEIALLNTLTRETELQELPLGNLQHNILKDRILGRVRFLSGEMVKNKFLAYENGKPQMVKAFRQVWRHRKDYWQKKVIGGSFNSQATNRYDTLELYDDDDDDCVPSVFKKKTPLKAKKPIIQPKNASNKSPQRRGPEESNTLQDSFLSYISPYPNKRPRTEAPKALSPIQNTSDRQVPIAAVITRSDTADTETREHIRFAEQVLRSPIVIEQASTPQPTASTASPPNMTRDQLMTPAISPDRTVDDEIRIDHPSIPPSIPVISMKSPTTPSMHSYFGAPNGSAGKEKSSASAPIRKNHPRATTTSTVPTRVPTTAVNSQSGKPEISLALQNSNKTWDLDNKVTASYLRALDLSAFFALFSQRSGVPLDHLDWLTFKLIFGSHPQQLEIINKNSGEEEWVNLKGKIRKFFKFVKSDSPRETEFDIWVEIGNRKEVAEENQEDPDGF